MSKITINPYVQIAAHLLCLIFYSANSQGLIPNEMVAKWITTVIGSTQSILAIYGIYTPSPTTPALPPPQDGGKN